MFSLPWQFLHAFEIIHQQLQASLTSLVENSPRVWMSTNGSDLVSEIKTRETNAEVILEVQLLEQLVDLEVQISSETAVIQARSLQDEVEGFFSSGQLQNIIPLPIPVHPEAVRAEWHDTLLTLTLPKSGRIDRQRIALQLSHSSAALEKPMVNL